MVLIDGEKRTNWHMDLCHDLAFDHLTMDELVKKYKKSKHTIYGLQSDARIKAEVTKLKLEFVDSYKTRLMGLVDDAFKTYSSLINTADRDSVRLKASEQILKSHGILTDKQEIELSGEVSMPAINIVSKLKSEE